MCVCVCVIGGLELDMINIVCERIQHSRICHSVNDTISHNHSLGAKPQRAEWVSGCMYCVYSIWRFGRFPFIIVDIVCCVFERICFIEINYSWAWYCGEKRKRENVDTVDWYFHVEIVQNVLLDNCMLIGNFLRNRLFSSKSTEIRSFLGELWNMHAHCTQNIGYHLLKHRVSTTTFFFRDLLRIAWKRGEVNKTIN